MKDQFFKHTSHHNGKFIFQLSILGRPLRSNEHFDTPEEAAISADLTKHFLRTEYKLDLANSLNVEQFSCLAYSRRGVNLSDSSAVFKSLPEDVRDFIEKHKTDLEAHRESAPPETTANKFRRSGMIEIPAVREWVEKLELAEMDANAFAALNSEFLFRLIDALPNRLTEVLKPLRLAVKMHDSATNPRLVARADTLAALIVHIEQTLNYVSSLSDILKVEQIAVQHAVADLEANRPSLA